jgi:apolipoprotein N-acyltransferase
MVEEAPVYAESETLYLRWGDWFAWLTVVLAIGGLLSAGVLALIRAKHVDRP